jgi:hypothetical protein
MFSQLSRRFALKIIGFSTAVLGLPRAVRAASGLADADRTISPWRNTHDRVWLGEDYWANPMEDWRVVDGAAEVQTSGGNRNIHLLTHQLTDPAGDLEMSVAIDRVAIDGSDGGAGFRIGVRSEINEYRSNVFAKGGVPAGVIGDKLVLGNSEVSINATSAFRLSLSGKPMGDRYELTLSASYTSGKSIGTIKDAVSMDTVLGNVVLISNYNPNIRKGKGARYRFGDWAVHGSAFTRRESHKFGPILWSMYSLSDSRTDE